MTISISAADSHSCSWSAPVLGHPRPSSQPQWDPAPPLWAGTSPGTTWAMQPAEPGRAPPTSGWRPLQEAGPDRHLDQGLVPCQRARGSQSHHSWRVHAASIQGSPRENSPGDQRGSLLDPKGGILHEASSLKPGSVTNSPNT